MVEKYPKLIQKYALQPQLCYDLMLVWEENCLDLLQPDELVSVRTLFLTARILFPAVRSSFMYSASPSVLRSIVRATYCAVPGGWHQHAVVLPTCPNPIFASLGWLSHMIVPISMVKCLSWWRCLIFSPLKRTRLGHVLLSVSSLFTAFNRTRRRVSQHS